MATDWTKETRSNEKKVTILAAANSFASKRLSDQNVYKLGANRRSEILGKIGNTKQTYEKIYNNYEDKMGDLKSVLNIDAERGSNRRGSLVL